MGAEPSRDWGGGWLSWHHSPLFGEAPSHPTSIASTVQAYLNAGVPRAKLGIGVGLYGLFYNNPVTGPRQAATSGSNGGDERLKVSVRCQCLRCPSSIPRQLCRLPSCA